MTDPAAGDDAGDRSALPQSSGPESSGFNTRGSERQKRRRLQHERHDADLIWLMCQREGRRFMWRLLQSCRLYETGLAGTSAAFFREGERNVGLRVLADIVRLCPDLHARMAIEFAARSSTKENDRP